MPESKVCKEAKSKARKKQSEEFEKIRKKRRDRKRLTANTECKWVPWVFIPVGLLGMFWTVTWNLAGNYIGFMRAPTEWNILTVLGLIIACFSLMTPWR